MNLKGKLSIRWIRITVVGGAIYLPSVIVVSFFVPSLITALASTLANALVISLVRFRSGRGRRKFRYGFFLLLPISYILIFAIGEYQRYFDNKKHHEDIVGRLIYVSPVLSPAEVWEDIEKSVGAMDNSFYKRIEEGNGYLESGDGKRAAEIYQALVDRFPDDGSLHYNLGYVFQMAGRYRDAAREYQEALKLGADKAHVNNNLGYVYHRLRRWDEALEFYSQSLQEFKKSGDKPGISRVYTNLGGIYQIKGQWDKALENYNRGAEG